MGNSGKLRALYSYPQERRIPVPTESGWASELVWKILYVYSGQDKTDREDRTGQGRTGQDRTGQDRARQVRRGQGRAGQGRAGQDRAGQDRAGLLGGTSSWFVNLLFWVMYTEERRKIN